MPSTNNSRKNTHLFSTFDFATFSTNTNHNKTKFTMRELINFCFKGGSGNHIAITRFGASWVEIKVS